MTTQAHIGPIRFKDPADPKGGWRDVDLTMAAAADGTVAPKGHPGRLSLAGASKAAGGGAKGAAETDLAVARPGKGKRRQDREVTLGWGRRQAGHTKGLLTGQTITRPGTGGPLTFKAAYDADGNMTVQKLPWQVIQTTGYDQAGEPVSLTYSGTVQPVKPRTQTDPDTGGQVPVTDANGDRSTTRTGRPSPISRGWRGR